MSKNEVETDGPQMTSQYGTYALHAGLATLHARMRMHISMRPGTHIHARERTSILRCIYIACLVFPEFSQWSSFTANLLLPFLFHHEDLSWSSNSSSVGWYLTLALPLWKWIVETSHKIILGHYSSLNQSALQGQCLCSLQLQGNHVVWNFSCQ